METVQALRRRELALPPPEPRYSLGFAPDQVRSIGQLTGPTAGGGARAEERRAKRQLRMRPRFGGMSFFPVDGLLEHDGCVNTVKWNRDGNLLITGSDDRKVKIWDTSSYWNIKLKTTINTDFVDNIFFADFVPGTNDQWTVSCAADGFIRLHNLERSDYEHVLNSSNRKIHGFIFWNEAAADNAVSNVMFTAQEDGSIIRYDLREPFGGCGSSTRIIGRVPIKALAMPSERSNGMYPYQLAIGGAQKSVLVYDLRMGIPNFPLRVREREECVQAFCPTSFKRVQVQPNNPHYPELETDLGVSGMMYSHDAKKLLVSFQGAQIYSFRTDDAPSRLDGTTAETTTYGGHINYDTFLKNVTYYGPRDEYVLSGSDSGHIWIWDERTARVHNLLEADSNGIANGVVPNPTDAALCSYGIDSNAKLWMPGVEESAEELDRDELGRILEKNVISVLQWRKKCRTVKSFLKTVAYLRREPPESGDGWPSYPRDLRPTDFVGRRPTTTEGLVDRLEEAAEQIKVAGNELFREGLVRKAKRKYEKARRYLQARDAVTMLHASVYPKQGDLLPKNGDLLSKLSFDHQCSLFLDKQELERHPALLTLKVSCLLNLAQCEILLNRSLEAIVLCTEVIEVDSKNAKAFYRRGCARLESRDYQLAVNDLTRAHNLAPSDAVRRKCAFARKKLAESRQRESNDYRALFEPSPSKSSSSAPQSSQLSNQE